MAGRKEMLSEAKRLGLKVLMARGRGEVCYRFFDSEAETLYDGPVRPRGTARGLKAARTWLDGFEAGFVTAMTKQVEEEVRR